MNLNIKSAYLLLLVSFAALRTNGQVIPIGFLDFDGHARSLQLLNRLDSNISFFVRPSNYGLGFDKSLKMGWKMGEAWTGMDATMPTTTKYYFDDGKGIFMVLPTTLRSKFNSHHPFGWIDEAMKAAKGLQSALSGGFFTQYGPFSLQVQPEYYQGSNPDFEFNSAYGAKATGAYSNFLRGNSSVLVHAGAMAAGFSTQSIWFGPGQYSSLILSNNATSFPHLSFHTTRPLCTPLGTFEWQLIAGTLDEDSASGGLYENRHLKSAVLKEDSRYYNAVNISFQPRFLKNVFIGAARAFQIYSGDLQSLETNFFNKYLVVLNPGFKKATLQDEGNRGDQQFSIFTRWTFPKSHAEFYFEYGQNDHKANFRDLAINVQAGAAYLVGFKKVIPLKQSRFIELNGEMIQMAQSADYLLRNTGNWYEHGQMSQGMTNDRQIIGAGSGFGNNVQSLKVNWVNGIQKIGIIAQRVQHDPIGFRGQSALLLGKTPWNELCYGINARFAYKSLIASLEIQYTSSKNYAWEAGNRKSNLYSLLNLAYLW